VVTATRYYYFAESDDQQSWEDGEGVYTAGGTTLTRETIYDSSNAGAVVNFTFAPRVAMGCPLAQTGGRQVLSADITYYVRTDGNDSNNGLANTSGGAFLTIQKAIDTAALLDCGIYGVLINIADGTYTGTIALKSMTGAGWGVQLSGNTGTPSNVVINVTGGCISADGVKSVYYIEGMKFLSSAGGGISANGGSYIGLSDIEFGACSGGPHMSTQSAAIIEVYTNYAISGSAPWHILADVGGVIKANGVTCTLSNSPVFSNNFAQASSLSLLYMISITYTGTAATGQRYTVATNAVINVNGAGTTYFPGSIAGSGTNSGTSPYGLYI